MGSSGFAKTLSRMDILDTLATSTPGVADLIVLGKIKQLEQSEAADLIVVDAPASGHAISFLRSASGLQATVDTGPIRTQADEAVAMLTDPARSQVVLVTLPEETPVNELVDTAYQLEDAVGVTLAPLVVNGADHARPDLVPTQAAIRRAADAAHISLSAKTIRAVATTARFWTERHAMQAEQMARLAHELPLDQLVLPQLLTPSLGLDDVNVLADALLAGITELHLERAQ